MAGKHHERLLLELPIAKPMQLRTRDNGSDFARIGKKDESVGPREPLARRDPNPLSTSTVCCTTTSVEPCPH